MEKRKRCESGEMHPPHVGVELGGDGSVNVYCQDIDKAASIAWQLRKRVEKRIITDVSYR